MLQRHAKRLYINPYLQQFDVSRESCEEFQKESKYLFSEHFNHCFNERILVTQVVKNPPAMRETWVRSLGWEDPLENGKATHSSILTWRIPWTV